MAAERIPQSDALRRTEQVLVMQAPRQVVYQEYEPQPLEEIIGDKGYHKAETIQILEEVEQVRAYIAEPRRRGRRRWQDKPEGQQHAVYANRRRIRGTRGLALLRRRSERLERPNAHLYETGGMRRTHLRGHRNILKRLLIHAGGFTGGDGRCSATRSVTRSGLSSGAFLYRPCAVPIAGANE